MDFTWQYSYVKLTKRVLCVCSEEISSSFRIFGRRSFKLESFSNSAFEYQFHSFFQSVSLYLSSCVCVGNPYKFQTIKLTCNWLNVLLALLPVNHLMNIYYYYSLNKEKSMHVQFPNRWEQKQLYSNMPAVKCALHKCNFVCIANWKRLCVVLNLDNRVSIVSVRSAFWCTYLALKIENLCMLHIYVKLFDWSTMHHMVIVLNDHGRFVCLCCFP